jgi:hypothetical protein
MAENSTNLNNPSFEECLKADSSLTSVYKKYVERIRERLLQGEGVLAVSEKYGGIIAITDRRVVLSSGGVAFEEYYYDKIGGVKEMSSLLKASITLDVIGMKNGLFITGIPKKRVGELSRLIGEQIHKNHSAQSVSTPTSQNDDIPTQLAKFAKLKEDGVITSEEFAAQKAKLLG